MARQLRANAEEILDDEGPQWSPKGKQITSKKPAKAFRRLYDAPVRTSRPINVYKERVVDADSGQVGWFVWWTTEDSKTVGKENIVKVIQSQQREVDIGEDFTIPYSEEIKKKLLSEAYGKTKFYVKDGEHTEYVENPEDF